MAGVFTWLWDWLLWMFWATKMDIAVVGLQNAGKTSLVRVLAVSHVEIPEAGPVNAKPGTTIGERVYH